MSGRTVSRDRKLAPIFLSAAFLGLVFYLSNVMLLDKREAFVFNIFYLPYQGPFLLGLTIALITTSVGHFIGMEAHKITQAAPYALIKVFAIYATAVSVLLFLAHLDGFILELSSNAELESGILKNSDKTDEAAARLVDAKNFEFLATVIRLLLFPLAALFQVWLDRYFAKLYNVDVNNQRFEAEANAFRSAARWTTGLAFASAVVIGLGVLQPIINNFGSMKIDELGGWSELVVSNASFIAYLADLAIAIADLIIVFHLATRVRQEVTQS